MAIRSVKVTNVSSEVTEQNIKEFCSFSGEIESIEIQRNEHVAYVTFKDPQGAETAVLLSGATIVDQSVFIELAPNYSPSSAPSAPYAATQSSSSTGGSVVQKAEDVVSSMLAKGFVLGKDALGKAKSFDEKHRFTSTATAKVSSLDQKIGLSQKFTAGTSMINEKMKEVDQKFQVSEKAKSTYAAAGNTVSSAGSAIMKNRYILTGATWVTGAFNRVTKAAGDVSQKTKEKVQAEQQSHQPAAHGYSPIHGSES